MRPLQICRLRHAFRLSTAAALGAVGCGAPADPANSSAEDPTSSAVQPLREPIGRQLGGGLAAAFQNIEPASVEVLSGIQVRSANLVDGIRFRYRHRGNGTQRWSEWTGGQGGERRDE